jgi:hypothetical protein
MKKARISHAFDTQDLADMKTATDTIKRVLLKGLRKADLDGLATGQAMGTGGGWDYCKLGYKTCLNFPKLYDDEQLDINEYGQGIDLATFLIDTIKDINTASDWASVLLNLKGRDLMEDTTHVRQRAFDKKGNVFEYIQVSADMNKMYDDRTTKAEATRKINDVIKDLKEQLAKKA